MSKDEDRAYLLIELLGRATRVQLERFMLGDPL